MLSTISWWAGPGHAWCRLSRTKRRFSSWRICSRARGASCNLRITVWSLSCHCDLLSPAVPGDISRSCRGANSCSKECWRTSLDFLALGKTMTVWGPVFAKTLGLWSCPTFPVLYFRSLSPSHSSCAKNQIFCSNPGDFKVHWLSAPSFTFKIFKWLWFSITSLKLENAFLKVIVEKMPQSSPLCSFSAIRNWSSSPSPGLGYSHLVKDFPVALRSCKRHNLWAGPLSKRSLQRHTMRQHRWQVMDGNLGATIWL